MVFNNPPTAAQGAQSNGGMCAQNNPEGTLNSWIKPRQKEDWR